MVVHADTTYSTLPDSDSPVKAQFESPPEIPRKPKKNANGAVNGNGEQNGAHSLGDEAAAPPKGVKRSHPDDAGPPLKKAKVTESGADNDVVIVEDAGGAIVID